MPIFERPAKTLLATALLLGLVFVVSGIAGIVFDRILLPQLSAMPSLQDLGFLKRATETVTVINKTEQVTVSEDGTVERIVSQPATAVVNIIDVGARTLQRTGVLLTNDGLIVTYEEPTVRDANVRAKVLMYDGSSHDGQFVGYDRLTNLAFYRVQGVNTPAIALANSNDARVGKRLIAIGNSAAEYQPRLSLGILGNRDRTFNLAGKSVASSEKWEGVFEMDTPQASSFLGGPAINYNGEMEGIVGSLIIDNAPTFFLIPSNAVRDSMNLAIAGELERRAELGVYYLPLTKSLALANSLNRDRGAMIYVPSGRTGLAVLSGSPAERAGLRNGDIVIAVEGKEINLDYPLSVAIGQFRKGDTISLLVLTGGAERTVEVTL